MSLPQFLEDSVFAEFVDTLNDKAEAVTALQVGDIKTSRLNADHGFWLKLDNRVLSQAEYPDLFAAMDTTPPGRDPGFSAATMYNTIEENDETDFRLPFAHPDEYDGFYYFIYAGKPVVV